MSNDIVLHKEQNKLLIDSLFKLY